jgi:hypothetical protein
VEFIVIQCFNSDTHSDSFMEFIVIQCLNSDTHSNVLTPMSTKDTSNRIMDNCSGISERFQQSV